MKTAEVLETKDMNYKNGYVECACGWRHEFRDGFNGHHIASCPFCDLKLDIREQRKVTYGRRNNLTVEIGKHWYFVMSNGIHVRYKKRIDRTYTGLSMRRADNL